MFSSHSSTCAWRQQLRADSIAALPAVYHQPFTDHDAKIHALSLADTAARCAAGLLPRADVAAAYAKRALAAHAATNCLTEVLFDDALRPQHSRPAPSNSLSGVPVSVKDCIDVAGYDSTVGYARNINRPAHRDAAFVRMLRDAGALVHSKDADPIGLLGLETFSDLWGYTSNPHNPAFAAGASGGGGAALLALGGAKIAVGTDVGGSVRIPAHWCGVYGIKASAGRFPTAGCTNSFPGLDAIPVVASPMAADLDDLEQFCKRIVDMRPWDYDHSCVPLPWRDADLADKKLKFGVLWSNGLVDSAPACDRALRTAVNALRRQGHDVVDFPIDVPALMRVAYPLIFADGGAQVHAPLARGESIEPAVSETRATFALPRLLKTLLAALAALLGDPTTAALLRALHPPSVVQQRALVAERDRIRQEIKERWDAAGLDLLLTPPHPLPAIPRGATQRVTMLSAAFTFMFNFLDLPAGVLPLTRVSAAADALPAPAPAPPAGTAAARAAWAAYDARAMAGLPVGVQVVGPRLEEERVLAGMRVVRRAVGALGEEWVREW